MITSFRTNCCCRYLNDVFGLEDSRLLRYLKPPDCHEYRVPCTGVDAESKNLTGNLVPNFLRFLNRVTSITRKLSYEYDTRSISIQLTRSKLLKVSHCSFLSRSSFYRPSCRKLNLAVTIPIPCKAKPQE